MARALVDLFSGPLDLRDKPTFRVVVAYEDSETAQHARNVCDYLLRHLGPQCRFLGQMWGFDVLQVPECRELAAKSAAAADVVMLSSHGDGDLPGEVKAWIEVWLQDEGGPQALVALFDRPRVKPERNWPIQDYLAGVAERGKISFFAEPDTWPGKGPQQIPLPFEAPFEARPEPLLPLSAGPIRSPEAAHWGINE